MNEYLKLVEEAQKKRIDLTHKQTYKIRKLYRDIARDLEKRIKQAPKNSLSERWLKDYQKQFKNDIRELNKILKNDIEDTMLKSAECAAGIQTDFFNLLDMKYGLNIKNSFSNMFSKIPQETLKELINGEFYKDGKGLSKRIWFNQKKANAEFDYIIEKGLTEKKSVYDLAKDLAKYVNPDVKKDWDFKKIYPNVGNKKIEYNSFRLAVTSVSHAYQLSMKRSCKANPFVEKIEWHTSNSHRGTCGLCQSRNGKKYTPDELPMDHPNGVCYFIPVIEKSLEDIGSELHDWLNGKGNNKLDSWYEGNRRERSDDNNIFKKNDKKDTNNVLNNGIISNNKWLNASFPTEKKFNKHIEKHLKEYDNITEEEYLNVARKLLSEPLSDDVEGFISEIGFIFKYRKSTNDFTIGRADGYISTLYKPKDGYKQWLEEIEKYKKE